MLARVPLGYVPIAEVAELRARDLSVDDASRRYIAIEELIVALKEGAVEALACRMDGQLFRIRPSDWRRAAFIRDIVIGGVVRASVGGDIERYHGDTVVVEEAALKKWLRQRTRAAIDTRAGLTRNVSESDRDKIRKFVEENANMTREEQRVAIGKMVPHASVRTVNTLMAENPRSPGRRPKSRHKN